jgi:hypothetical protein
VMLCSLSLSGCGGHSQNAPGPVTTVTQTQTQTVKVTQPTTSHTTVAQPQTPAGPTATVGQTPLAPFPSVTYLDYAPKRVYDDTSELRVRFTTTGGAPPKWRYVVSVLIEGPDTPPAVDCTAITFWGLLGPPRKLAGPGRTYTVWLRANGNYFCHGRATLDVELDTTTGPHPRILRKVDFRVLRAP